MDLAGKQSSVGLADTIASVDSVTGDSSMPRPAGDEVSLVGASLDHFVVERPLGAGGMGAVYVAQDVSLDRRVAIKVLRGALADVEHEERLLREARAQARLNHPNVVQIHYIGRRIADGDGAGSLFLAMELIDGEPLDAIVDRHERLPPEEARVLMLQISRGLRAARRAGIIHRDVKPSNLIRDRDGTVKIADFGLAKPVDGDVAITQEGGFVGSPLYMSPEQGGGDPVDHRSDMYSLGATMFHLLSGEPPFDGTSPLKVITSHMTKPIPKLPDDIPQNLRAIVRRLLAKERGDRYEDYDDLIEALQAAAPERTAHAGFWIRAAAVGIDTFIAAILIALIGWYGVLVHLAHITVGHALRGQTLAKYLVRLKVTRKGGRPLGWGRAFSRMVLALWLPIFVGILTVVTAGVSELATVIERIQPSEMAELQDIVVAVAISNGFLSLVFGAGLMLAGFHPEKRAMHDLVCDTVVTYKMGEGA